MLVQKLNYTIIDKPSNINSYYQLKHTYDVRKHMQNARCPNCKGKLKDLNFSIQNRVLISTCPTSGCKSNMNIQIGDYRPFNHYYSAHKKEYEVSITRILNEKFNVLFGYKKEEDISKLKMDYVEKNQNIAELIKDYSAIVNSHQDEIDVLNAKKEAIIDIIKQKINAGEKVDQYKELTEILCAIRKFKYSKLEMYDWKEISPIPYTIEQLEICNIPDK